MEFKAINQRAPAKRHARFLRSADSVSLDELAQQFADYPALDLALGAAEYDAEPEIKRVALNAILHDHYRYADIRGFEPLRRVIAAKIERWRGLKVNAETEITVTCGATEALTASLGAVVEPGDEVVIFEPFYEPYLVMLRFLGCGLRLVRLHEPDWSFDEQELRAAFTPRTAAVILNSPHNPTGKVFTRRELQLLADICAHFGAICISDEVYEHFVYDGVQHLSIAQLDGMRDRTVIISSASKTFRAPGFRVGYAIAPAPISAAIRERHEILSGGAPTPLQMAIARAFEFPDIFYDKLRQEHEQRRDQLTQILSSLGFRFALPRGGFYVFADFGRLSEVDDRAFAAQLLAEAGVAVMPGGCFYTNASAACRRLRFCFARSATTLETAGKACAQFFNRCGADHAL